MTGRSRSVDGYMILQHGKGWALVEVHSDDYKLPVKLFLDRSSNHGLNMVRDLIGAMEEPLYKAVLDICKILHYPECWDTVAYPTLQDAVEMMRDAFPCTTCEEVKD